MKFTPNRYLPHVAAIVLLILLSPAAGHGADTVRFGILPVVDTLPLIVGQEEKLFEKEDIDLELISFQSALERDAALQAGKLEGYFGDILNTVLLIHAGQKLKIVTTAYRTHPQYRMFGIAVSPKSGIDNLSGLNSRQVAISRATVIEYLLDRIFDTHGLPKDFAVKQEIKKIPIRLQMLLSDQVPAALLPEPLLTLAQSKGCRVLADDRLVDTAETVLAMGPSVLERPSLAERFLRAYASAVARINTAPENYKTLLITRTQFPMPVKEIYRIPQFPPVAPPPAKDIDDAQNWLIQNNMAASKLDAASLIFKPTP